jgi:hypothetical protein
MFCKVKTKQKVTFYKIDLLLLFSGQILNITNNNSFL